MTKLLVSNKSINKYIPTIPLSQVGAPHKHVDPDAARRHHYHHEQHLAHPSGVKGTLMLNNNNNNKQGKLGLEYCFFFFLS